MYFISNLNKGRSFQVHLKNFISQLKPEEEGVCHKATHLNVFLVLLIAMGDIWCFIPPEVKLALYTDDLSMGLYIWLFNELPNREATGGIKLDLEMDSFKWFLVYHN